MYNMLLNRLWIHFAGAIPSLLHQKINYIVDRKLVTISIKESLWVYKGPLMPYIETSDDDVIETPF